MNNISQMSNYSFKTIMLQINRQWWFNLNPSSSFHFLLPPFLAPFLLLTSFAAASLLILLKLWVVVPQRSAALAATVAYQGMEGGGFWWGPRPSNWLLTPVNQRLGPQRPFNGSHSAEIEPQSGRGGLARRSTKCTVMLIIGAAPPKVAMAKVS